MKQSSRSAAVLTRWRPARGFLLVLALLGLMAATIPAASAAPAVPSVGSVRHLDLDLDAKGRVPAGLSLAGAAFRFTAGGTTGTCVADRQGGCDVEWASNGKVSGDGTPDLRLPGGTYTVTQLADQPVAGLQPKPGSLATVKICDCWTGFWIFASPVTGDLDVQNTSLYRDRITAKVVDAVTGAPVRWSLFRLTGPGAGAGGTEVLSLTNWDGELTFGSLPLVSNYRPGQWTITPVSVDPKYATTPVTVELSASAPGTEKWHVGTISLAVPPPPPPPAPQTGSGRVQLQTEGPVPTGLDLSGAEFTLTGTSGATATCLTDEFGTCAVEVVPSGGTSELPATGATEIALPAGTYAVDQESAPAGLAPDADVEDLVLCTSATAGECAAEVVAQNLSLFSQSVSVGVSGDGVAVEGMELSLSGPGYPVRPAEGTAAAGEPAAAWPEYRSAPVATGADGTATWDGWFVPGTWTITTAGVEEPLLVFDLPTTPEQALLIELPATEDPDTGGGPDDGTGNGPTTPTTTPTATPTSAAPTTAVTPSSSGPAAGGGGSAPVASSASAGPRAPVAGAQVRTPATDSVQTPPAASSSAPRTSAPAGAGSDRVDGEQLFVADEPELQTAGSEQLFSPGLVLGVGVLFVAVVIGGVMLVRRRASSLR